MIRAILIDDEPLAREVVKEYLADYPQVEVIGECGDGFEGVKAVNQHRPDLIFLDIQMPKITGFEMLDLLDEKPAVIFTTAFDEFAIKAFEANAIDYLLKPFHKARFDQAMKKWLAQRDLASARQQVESFMEKAPSIAPNDRIVVKTAHTIKIIPTAEVIYFEAYDDYVKINTGDGTFLKSKTMQYFENLLDPNLFVRIHRSFIVQISQISRLEPYERDTYLAILKNGDKLPVSKTGYSKLKGVLGI